MGSISYPQLKQFVEKFDDFYSLEDLEQFKIFGYYVQEIKGDPLLDENDIEECYSTLDLPIPDNIKRKMTVLEEKTSLVPKGGAWRISGLIKSKIEKEITIKTGIVPKNLEKIHEVKNPKDIFIVHGHDNEAKQEVARFIEKLGLTVVILHEQPNKGMTVIEKLIHYSKSVGFAIILLTPDDIGYLKGEQESVENRARQNVVLELGYFVGKIGRERVCTLLKNSTELPSDFNGVLYVPMDTSGTWKLDLAKELQECNFQIDFGKIS